MCDPATAMIIASAIGAGGGIAKAKMTKTPVNIAPVAPKPPAQQPSNPLAEFFQRMQQPRPSATPPFNPSPGVFGGGGGYPGSVYDVF